MKNQITFYVPTLNSESTIKECLKSIIALGKYNIMVIDGGSSDNTVKLVKKLRVLIFPKKSKHLANARNLAMKDCKTKYIAFIDSDCVINKKWLLNIMKNLSKNVAGVCGRLEEKFTESLADKWRTFHLKQHWGDNKIKNPDFLFGSNTIFMTDALKKVDGFNEKYKTNFEDVDVSRRLKRKGHDIVYEPKAVCFHLKKDNLISVLQMTRRWSFFSYPITGNYMNLLKRIFVYNNYSLLYQFIKDICNFKFNFLLITVLSYFYNQIYDITYLLTKP